MKIDRLLLAVSLLISLVAVTVSTIALKRDPLGTDVSAYDLSSPQNTLRAINRMVATQDLKAAWQLLKVNLQSESSEMNLFLAENAQIQVLKSIEVANSANPKNNGLIVSFVKFTIAGVDYRTVQYFRKDQSNRFMPGGSYYVPYGTKKNDEDVALETAVEAFKQKGQL